MSITRLGKMVAMWAVLVAAFLVISASAGSKARIVRLSQVQGTVQFDRAGGNGFDRAFINLPVIENSRLRTGKDGRAEVEFEDGSALRLAPNSEVDFIRLALGDDGQKLNTVQLVSGTLYASLHPKHAGQKTGDQFLLNFAHASVTVPQAAHFRVQLADAKATVAVFKGKLSATSPAGQIEVAEKHSATIELTKNDLAKNDLTKNDPTKNDLANSDPASKDTFVIARNYNDDPSDDWDRQQNDYHNRYAPAASASLSSPYGYGTSDLSYYGSFTTLPGFGFVWQPYFIGADWSPFQDGGWALYPGAGYMWVSGYPWGWMPYNYGNWAFAPGYGYVWQPGNWNTWNAHPLLLNAPGKTIVPTAPASGPQTVMLGLGLAAYPAGDPPSRLTINPGSAGFGVPRGSIDRLDHLAKTMNRTSRPVVASTIQPVSAMRPAPGFATAPSLGSGSGPSSTRGGTASTTTRTSTASSHH